MNGFNLSLIFVLGLSALPVQAISLSAFEWQYRPLLIFAPQQQDHRLQQLNKTLIDKTCELDDRDMVIGVFVTQGPSHLAKQTMSAQQAEHMRKQYEIQADQFAVLLIGKDGGEKYRLYEIPDLSEIFDLIDGMPMRQAEMQQQSVDCK